MAAYDPRLDGVGVLTDEQGRFEIEVESGLYRLRALPEGLPQVERFWPAAWRFCDASVLELEGEEEIAGLDFRLPLGGSLEGRLVDEQGGPLAGVELACRGLEYRTEGVRRSATSDEDGVFEVQGLDGEPGRDQLYLCEMGGETVPDQYAGGTHSSNEGEAWEARLGESRDLGELELLLGARVEGSLDSELGPVAGASVHLYSNGQVRSVASDELGLFLGEGLPAGDLIGWASQDGWSLTYYPDSATPQVAEEVAEGETLLDYAIWMPVEATLRGQIQPAEQDLSGVTLLAWNESFTVGIGAQAEADGSFEVRRLHPGPHALYVYAEPEGFLQDYARDEAGEVLWLEAEVGGSAPHLVELQPAAWLEGRLVDDEGAPVYGATVSLRPVDEELKTLSAVSDREGRWSMDGVSAGSYRLDARMSPYCPTDRSYVPIYWPGTPDARAIEELVVGEAELRGALDLEMPLDLDHDAMADAWERRWQLDPERDDAAQDPDQDGASNLAEYLDGTNPREDLVRGCSGGCGSAGAGGLVPALVALLLSLRGAAPARRRRAPRARRTCAGSS